MKNCISSTSNCVCAKTSRGYILILNGDSLRAPDLDAPACVGRVRQFLLRSNSSQSSRAPRVAMSLIDFEQERAVEPGRCDRADRRAARLGVRAGGGRRDHHLGRRRLVRLPRLVLVDGGQGGDPPRLRLRPEGAGRAQARGHAPARPASTSSSGSATSTCGARKASSCSARRCCSPAAPSPTSAQVERLLLTAIEACERYFQAFQFVVWAGKSAPEALETVLFETVGAA